MQGTKLHRRGLCLLVILCLALSLSAPAFAESVSQPYLENLTLSVDGGPARTVRALHYDYANNRYVSLRDMAAALSGTPRRFGMRITNDIVVLTTGTDYSPVGGEGEPFPDTNSSGAPYTYSTRALALNTIELDGRALRYLSFLGLNSASQQDCFLSLTDLAMQLDLDVTVSSGFMAVNTASGFRIDLDALEKEGFFYEIHSALAGDATTGVIYAAWQPELPVPIASTTKLMSFVIVMDAVADGEITLGDTVTITEEAARLSRTPDGRVSMEAGWETTIPELLCGMLLRSSNECTLALAIHTAGSEAAFVERMNRKARAIGLSDGTVFYNCHGLPVYTDNLPATKVQNRMSAMDMFELVSCLLRSYPDITRITSMQSAELPTLHTTVWNTNPLLSNLPGAVGLKTGTTNMSGSCLVGLMEAEDAEGARHMLVSVEFGAEDSSSRTTLSEELLRYALQELRERPDPIAPDELPDDAESLIRAVMRKYG